MCKSRINLALLIISLLISGNVLADTVWTNTSGDHLWSNPDNWTAGVPNYSGVAQINVDIASGPIVNSDNAWTSHISVGHTDVEGTATVTVTGGDLESNWFGLGFSGGAGGTGKANGILNMQGGTVTAYYDFLVGGDGGGDGTINMIAGTIYAHRLWIGYFEPVNGGMGSINLDGVACSPKFEQSGVRG